MYKILIIVSLSIFFSVQNIDKYYKLLDIFCFVFVYELQRKENSICF